MSKKLWEASLKQKKNSNLFAFENYISRKYNKNFDRNYEKLLDWSIKNYPKFWSSFWDFTEIKGIKGKKPYACNKIKLYILFNFTNF